MLFREPWWQASSRTDKKQLETLSFLFTSRRTPPVWWTTHPEPQPLPTLTGWAGGPRATQLTAQLTARAAEDLGRTACDMLAEVFALPAERVHTALVSTHLHDWSADPFSLGAYSYIPAGALDAPATMAEPEQHTLFFAGEHTDITGHWGTVHAAIRSGLRAAAQVLGESSS
jgi:hypothetical protein